MKSYFASHAMDTLREQKIQICLIGLAIITIFLISLFRKVISRFAKYVVRLWRGEKCGNERNAQISKPTRRKIRPRVNLGRNMKGYVVSPEDSDYKDYISHN